MGRILSSLEQKYSIFLTESNGGCRIWRIFLCLNFDFSQIEIFVEAQLVNKVCL
jgi:hypothetical protein